MTAHDNVSPVQFAGQKFMTTDALKALPNLDAGPVGEGDNFRLRTANENPSMLQRKTAEVQGAEGRPGHDAFVGAIQKGTIDPVLVTHEYGTENDSKPTMAGGNHRIAAGDLYGNNLLPVTDDYMKSDKSAGAWDGASDNGFPDGYLFH